MAEPTLACEETWGCSPGLFESGPAPYPRPGSRASSRTARKAPGDEIRSARVP